MTARPLRIVILDSWHAGSAEGSGTAVGLRGLATGLSRLGHRVEIMRPRRGARSTAVRISFNLDLARRLAAVDSVDLVVGVDIDGFAWAGREARRGPDGGGDAGRPPYVVCLKGIAADEARFEEGPARAELQTLARLERLNATRADLVVVPSRYSAEVAARLYGLPDARIRIVPEPVDLSRWTDLGGPAPERPTRPPGAGTILSVARQYPRKDTETLVRAAALLLRDCPEARVRIVGDGPTLPHSRALARELRIEDSVTFLGGVSSDDDVAREYRMADVFCLPSRQEGFGIVFVEAMAAGLPIVAAAAGAVPEVVPAGVAGTLVPTRDPGALAAALRMLLCDPALRARWGRAGTERARRYDLAPVARAFLDEVRPLLP